MSDKPVAVFVLPHNSPELALAPRFLPPPDGGWVGPQHTFLLYQATALGEPLVADYMELHYFDSKDAAGAWCEQREAV